MPQLSRHTESSLSEINIVPFVDVMLVLLVIFMITAPILQSGIEVDVPKTKTVKEISDSRVVVSIEFTSAMTRSIFMNLATRCMLRCIIPRGNRSTCVAIRQSRSVRSRW
jgi:biopolymer transport protein ExbD